MSEWDIINYSDIQEDVAEDCLSDGEFVLIAQSRTHATSPTISGKNTSRKDTLPPNSENHTTITKTPTHQLIEIVFKDLSYPGFQPADGLVSFHQHPRTWFSHMMKTKSYQSVDIRIMHSVGMIHRMFKDLELLRVILWASLYDWGDEELEFWKKVEQSALGLLDEKVFLVHVMGKALFIRGLVEWTSNLSVIWQQVTKQTVIVLLATGTLSASSTVKGRTWQEALGTQQDSCRLCVVISSTLSGIEFLNPAICFASTQMGEKSATNALRNSKDRS